MDKFYQSPEYKEEEIKSINDIKDSHYSSLVFGGKQLFSILEEHYKDEGQIIGISVSKETLNVFFKNKGSESKEISLDNRE
jgi:hypothetical protein